MLVPITREKFEELVPTVSTSAQYTYYWGKGPELLRRFLISFLSLVAVFVVGSIFGSGLRLIFGLVAGLYWLWAPAMWSSLRNRKYRQFGYSGFWQGQVLDVFVSEELIGKEETVNEQGELVIVENRERRINLEVGDESGFNFNVQAPLKREHKAIRSGDVVEMLVFSNRPDLSQVAKVSDAYLPDANLWVSDYPCLQRDVFVQVSRRLGYEEYAS
ncbi:MAG: phosphate ABC transporter permease [Thermosynechococcaceae cyanobacterium]